MKQQTPQPKSPDVKSKSSELSDNALDKVSGGGLIPTQSDMPGKEDIARGSGVEI